MRRTVGGGLWAGARWVVAAPEAVSGCVVARAKTDASASGDPADGALLTVARVLVAEPAWQQLAALLLMPVRQQSCEPAFPEAASIAEVMGQ